MGREHQLVEVLEFVLSALDRSRGGVHFGLTLEVAQYAELLIAEVTGRPVNTVARMTQLEGWPAFVHRLPPERRAALARLTAGYVGGVQVDGGAP